MNDEGRCVVARIMYGGMIHRQGKHFKTQFCNEQLLMFRHRDVPRSQLSNFAKCRII